MKETYLGDGLYVSSDGWWIRLRASRADGDHEIFIEPLMWAPLVEYARKVWHRDEFEGV
jgi:hypothetical protein